MSDYSVVVVSGAHARFFTLEAVEFPELESGPRLVERGEILSPERKMREVDLYADSKTGRGRAPGGGRPHGYDDHRSQHEEEFGRRFAREILERASKIARNYESHFVVLAAPKRMLGFLRPELDLLVKQGLEVRKFAKDMIKFAPEQIHDHLAKKQYLPERKKITKF